MKVAVLKAGKPLPSKYDYGMCQRVTMENLDGGEPKYVYLNMTDDVKARWLPAIREGNVLNVFVTVGTDRVNKYGQYQVIRKVSDESN